MNLGVAGCPPEPPFPAPDISNPAALQNTENSMFTEIAHVTYVLRNYKCGRYACAFAAFSVNIQSTINPLTPTVAIYICVVVYSYKVSCARPR